MALVKQSNAREMAREAIVLDLGDLQRQGDQILALARDHASKVIAEGRKERDRLIADADAQGRAAGTASGHAEGLKLGQAEGRAAALKERSERLAALESAWQQNLESFQSMRDDLIADAGRDVLRLAVLIAERITKRAIQLNPQAAVDQLAAVLAVVVRPTELVVRLHPSDRGVVTDALPKLVERFTQARHVELIDDATLQPGSCIATTRSVAAPGTTASLLPGEIDASIGTQLDRIVEVLLPGEPRQAAGEVGRA